MGGSLDHKEEGDGWEEVWVLRGRRWMGGGLDHKEEGDGWEEVWVLKRKEMDGRKSGS